MVAVVADQIITYYKNQKMMPKLAAEGQTATEDARWKQVLSQPDKVIEMQKITKAFPGIKVLDDVSVTFAQGEIHALAGENGAGKSTLMKILTGEMKADLGQIYINNVPVRIDHPAKAEEIGISIIHQELALVPELTVAQNIFLGKEIKAKIPGFISKREMNRRAQELIDRLDLNIDARSTVSRLTVSEQQMIEIIKAVEKNSWMIIMDVKYSMVLIVYGVNRIKKKRKIGTAYTNRKKNVYRVDKGKC